MFNVCTFVARAWRSSVNCFVTNCCHLIPQERTACTCSYLQQVWINHRKQWHDSKWRYWIQFSNEWIKWKDTTLAQIILPLSPTIEAHHHILKWWPIELLNYRVYWLPMTNYCICWYFRLRPIQFSNIGKLDRCRWALLRRTVIGQRYRWIG